MNTHLSPSAQAVWNAWNDAYEAQGPLEDMGQPIAAALRAVADQVASPIQDVCTADVFNRQIKIRVELRAIAAELEGSNG
jgi:hypothetical protein